VPPQLDTPANAPENSFRNSVLELMGRLPVNEVPKPRVTDLIHVCQAVLDEDHEDNGAIAQRLLFDIHKAHKQALEDATAPFFEWLKTLFEGMPAAVERQLAATGDEPKPLLAARESMKIAQDVALMVFFLFQSYPKRMSQFGPALLPLMVNAAAMLGPDLDDVSPEAMPFYTDFRMAQIKTVLFIIALSRYSHMVQLLTPYRDQVCTALLRLMVAAPASPIVRKEVLSCMRNMLNTPFRSGLQVKIDELLDQKTLLGSDRVSADMLRQLAFSNLAELVALSKKELSLSQLRRVVRTYSRNAMDVSSPVALQTTSLRLLNNIIEVLAQRGTDATTAEAYREMISAILDCMVAKLSALKDQVPRHVCDLRDIEDTRKDRKAVEAASAADHETAGKRSVITRRKQLREKVAELKKLAEAASESQAPPPAGGGEHCRHAKRDHHRAVRARARAPRAATWCARRAKGRSRRTRAFARAGRTARATRA